MRRAHCPPIITGRKEGSALIVVLLFVILLTVLIITFLARSMTAVRVSASSSSEAKANLLAASAGNIIIGDLKQEIVAGSTSSGTTSWPIYSPTTNVAMIPFRSGVPISGTLIPNLISRSVRPGNTNGASPYVPYSSAYTSTTVPPNRAADDSTPSKVSTLTPSLNGRFMSAVQWNSHYLIPRDPGVVTAGSTSTRSDPTTSFVAPDWVVVTRQGASSQVWNSTLTDATQSNTNYAVGRYAYAVYNEGGLLDMNAAGYPGGLTATQIGRKGSLALADLTQLTAGAVSLTQAQINNFVAWRNYASAGLTSVTGAYGNASFTAANSTGWLTNFVSNNTNGFMRIVAPTGVTAPSDQAVLSRQQLIGLTTSLGMSPDFLQYMGTFSRALEQPSYVPDTSRPRIIASGSAPPAATAVDSYLGNSDAQGGDDTINPSFLSIRVKTAFTRLNGTTAVVGEPLVKTRFALSRLALVTYTSTATKTAGNAIYDRFGLYRASVAAPWTYNHGSNSILTLAQVRDLATPREPDFAELLKAAITAGSLAKGAPNLHNDQGNYQYTLDTTLDYHVLQIMANLIDQYDADSYPTVIQLPVGSSNYTVYGVEDLPYFYRYHLLSVVDKLPSPIISNASTATFPGQSATTPFTTTGSTAMATTYPGGATTSTSWDATPGTTTPTTVAGVKLGTMTAGTNQGEATYFYIPDLWNPHAYDTRATSTTLRPAKFRIYAVTDDPALLTPAWKVGVRTGFNVPNQILPQNNTANTISIWPTSTPAAFTLALNQMTFADNGGLLFREPTLLWNTNPTGLTFSSLGVTDANVKISGSPKNYYGIIAGKSPVSIQATFTSTPAQATDGTYIFQGATQSTVATLPVGSFQQITFFLQYLDANNNWITYDVKYPDLHGLQPPNLVVNVVDFPNNSYQDCLRNGQFSANATSFDPRAARWGIGTASTLGQVSLGTAGNTTDNTPFVLEPTANTNFNNSFYLNDPTANATMNTSLFSVLETDRPRADKCNLINYSNPGMTSDPGQNFQMRIFSGSGWSASNGVNAAPVEWSGLLSQNNPAGQFFSRDNGTAAQSIYIEDTDGVARRAMGAYADTTFTDANKLSQAQAIATTPNRIGLPLATANTLTDKAIATGTAQGQSRPIILNRAFRSVSEMSYSFRGTPWKNIDFFTPESGDSALLDTFCVSEPNTNAVIAGRVDLNTRQPSVLAAIVAGAYRDEFSNVATPPAYALPALNAAEAANVATKLTGITSDTTHTWRGPLRNISELVGHYVASPGSTTGFTDFYTYAPPSPVAGQPASITYAGLSAALDSTVYTNANNSASTSAPLIQRFREAGMRPLVDAGQVRVWNLLIDVVAQTGKYPKTANGLDQFLVEGQSRVWLHVAIDRYTGQVIDKQVEIVTP